MTMTACASTPCSAQSRQILEAALGQSKRQEGLVEKEVAARLLSSRWRSRARRLVRVRLEEEPFNNNRNSATFSRGEGPTEL